jgi:hypothetical protein
MSDIPKPLLDDIAAGKCLPFVGAGFSLNAKLPSNGKMPDWQALTEILAKAANVSPKQPGPKVASSYERIFGRVQLIDEIRYALHSDSIEHGEAHTVFANLPFDTIYTTNFDHLLEQANISIRRPYRSLVGELQIPFHGGPLCSNIVKMHGDLRHEEHIIVTQEDYDQYLEKYPVISTHLSAMLITRTALFIGYSLTDPDFTHIREVVRSRLGKFQRMSYVVQFNLPNQTVEKMFDQRLHVINLSRRPDETHDTVLTNFFQRIQEELDTRASVRMRVEKPEVFEDISPVKLEETSRAPDATALLSSTSNLCFVLMPFAKPFDNIYREIIAPVIRQAGLDVMRADQILAPGSVMEQIRSSIQHSRICVADITGRNPNVLYELGIAQTLGKPTILMTQDMDDIPFDIRQYRVIKYDLQLSSIEGVKNDLMRSITTALGTDRLDEARALIDSGLLRAGVAILGSLLEHGLRHLVIDRKLVNINNCDNIPRTLTIGKMIKLLVDAQLLSANENQFLQKCLEIRNKAVHDLSDPTARDAKLMMKWTEVFVRRYIGFGFVGQKD